MIIPYRYPRNEFTYRKEASISVKIYVGNLNYDTTQSELELLFSEVGQVVEAFLPADRDTGRPRGFAFVEFIDEMAVQKAVEKFDGYEFKGRNLRVTEAEERQQRTPNFTRSGGGYSSYQGQKKAKRKGSRRNIRAQKRGH